MLEATSAVSAESHPVHQIGVPAQSRDLCTRVHIP